MTAAVGHRIAPARFLIFAAALVVAGSGASALGCDPRTALLIGFDIAVVIFLCSLARLLKAAPELMRRTAAQNDANRVGLLAINVPTANRMTSDSSTVIASPGKLDRADIVLIVATLALAWLFANMVFTLHYAHLYYLQKDGRDQRGIEVPGVREPGYWDVLYFSFTLGMTFQTSDVTISGAHMRRVVLGHCMAAFVFNMGILAFTVNAIGGS